MIDHERADELLAGYVLESLTGDDAAEAERLLTEHVPDCRDCRATLDAFQAVSGDLGMSPVPADPPQTLLPRLHRSLDGGRQRGLPAWNPKGLIAAAAAAIVVVGVAGLVVTQRDRTTQPQLLSQADLADVHRLMGDPTTNRYRINQYADELSSPQLEVIYVFGRDVPSPPTGSIYRLWTVDAAGDETWVGDFVPIEGSIALRVAIDPATIDHLLVTVEPANSEPSQPGETTWAAAA